MHEDNSDRDIQHPPFTAIVIAIYRSQRRFMRRQSGSLECDENFCRDFIDSSQAAATVSENRFLNKGRCARVTLYTCKILFRCNTGKTWRKCDIDIDNSRPFFEAKCFLFFLFLFVHLSTSNWISANLRDYHMAERYHSRRLISNNYYY